MSEPAAFESVSTWQQPIPSTRSPDRAALLDALAGRVLDLGTGRLRVAVDGRTAAGKTSFGHELAAAIRSRGRPTLRASLDDFASARILLLDPLARTAQGRSPSVSTTR